MATALLRSSIARFDGSSFGRIFRNQFLEKVCVALQATCSSHHAFFHRADFHTRNILCACGTCSERCADSKNRRLQHHNPSERSRDADATRSGRTWAAPVVHAALRRRFRPAAAVLAGRFELAAQEFPDLAQAGNLGLERSRCVVVRRLGVGALRHRRIDAMKFGGSTCHWPCSSLLPLTLPALIARRSVVLFTPAAAAAAARVRLMAVRLVAVRDARTVASEWLPSG